MKLVGNYKEAVRNLISGSESYTIPTDIKPSWTQHDYEIAVSESPIPMGEVFSNNFPVMADASAGMGGGGAPPFIPDESAIGTATPIQNSQYQERPIIKTNVLSSVSTYRASHELEFNKDFYIKNNLIYLKPNELLDREQYRAGDYILRFEFLRRLSTAETSNDNKRGLYLAEVSPTRKEIRLNTEIKSSDQDANTSRINTHKNHITKFLHNSQYINPTSDNYKPYGFEGYVELSRGRLIPINAFAFDSVTTQGQSLSLILKLNEEFPTDIPLLDKSIRIVRKWFSSQTEAITFIDEDNLATGGGRPLPIDTGYITENSFVDDDVYTYGELQSGSEDVIAEITQNKKDQNLNIDFSEFSNHVFFGSAVSKLENFKSKVVKLEGLYNELSQSFTLSTGSGITDYRKDLFYRIRKEKENFTAYERFMYNDNQKLTSNSPPGLGVNLAGNKFRNKRDSDNTTTYKIISGSSALGFDKLHVKRTYPDGASTFTRKKLHLFTDKFHAEKPPFYNTNDWVYLSFILKGTGIPSNSASSGSLVLSGSDANVSMGETQYYEYDYGRNYQIPANAFSGSAYSNPIISSSFQRYIFRSQQNYFRPVGTDPNSAKSDVFDMTDYSSTSTEFEILSGSNVISASISGSAGDGFAYGIRDSSGQQTQYIFPTVVDRNNLSNTFKYITGSLLPQGDLFPIFLDTGNHDVYFTDVRVSKKDPTNVHPFSQIYRPPSGSYAGSDEWNDWWTGIYTSASLYDDENIHSLVNNLPNAFKEGSDHVVLRNFVNMLGEQFDLLRNYIDNYLNFYKLGYTNPNSMPDNLLPILGDAVGWELLNNQNKSTSIEDYAHDTAGDEVGVQAVINSTWKKILNNLMYVYKTKGTTESIQSLLNLYGFDSNGFQMHEYGGSTAEHNPTIITNDSQDFISGMKNVKGNVSYVKNIEPFPMINFRGTNSLGVDWWRNDATANGIEFVFNADKTTNEQTILRSSGSNNDLWDLRLIPSASSTDFSRLQFRLNNTTSGSGAITNNAVSMSSPYVDFQDGNIYNVFLQRLYVTGSSPSNEFTQSYHMFVARKDDDKIKNVSATSMSCEISGANYNFVEQASAKSSENLFVGESLSGSLAELRSWNTYVSMSKFKQHTLNYRSTVANSITGSVVDLIYRYPFDENIVNWSTNPNSASLKLHDANPQNVKDYSIFILSQSNFNFTTTMTEQTFYRLAVKGTDKLPNDNQTNLTPKVTIVGELSPDQNTIDEPRDSSGQAERQYTNRFGRDVSYVNAIDSLIMNQMPDFRIDDFIGDPDEDLTDTYEDLMNLRKSLIVDPNITTDVVKNLRSVEGLISDEVKETVELLTPAKTNFEMFYDVKNDTLFRSKIGRKMKMSPKLNPNKAIGNIDADQFDEPTIIALVNNNKKEATIDADQWDEPTVTSFVNKNLKIGTVDADQWDEPTLSSTLNDKFKTSIAIDTNNLTVDGSREEIYTPSVNIEMVDTSNSANQTVYSVTPYKMNEFFLGSKNHIAENAGTSSNQRFFKSGNPGTGGDYNTYKFENRFTFKTIGDTERFHNSQSIHDEFHSFRNRYFVDQTHVSNFKYKSYYGAGAGINGAPKDGRMVGRTRFFSSSNGEIFYPSNHYIHARTSKDALWNLIYKGTQHDGSNPTQDPLKNDPQPKVSAYVVSVAGSDTINRIKVDRPISKNIRIISLAARGEVGSLTFNLYKRNKLLMSKNLHTKGTTYPARDTLKFNMIGDAKDYNFTIVPVTSGIKIDRVRVRKQKVGTQFVQKASVSTSRNPDGSQRGRFTKILGDFTLTIQVRD